MTLCHCTPVSLRWRRRQSYVPITLPHSTTAEITQCRADTTSERNMDWTLRLAVLAIGPLLLFLTTALGNSLQPIGIITWIQVPATLVLLHAAARLERQDSSLGRALWARLVTFLPFAQCLLYGWIWAFWGLFDTGGGRYWGMLVSLLGALWVALLLLLSGLPTLQFYGRFPGSPLTVWVFPVTFTALQALIGFTPLATYAMPANALLANREVAMLASLFGAHGLNFMLAVVASFVDMMIQPHIKYVEDASAPSWAFGSAAGPDELRRKQQYLTQQRLLRQQRLKAAAVAKRQLPAVSAVAILLLLVAGFLQYGSLRHVPVEQLAAPELTASCILAGTEEQPASARGQAILRQTAERLKAGDDIVLWSEVALAVAGAQGEQELWQLARQMLKDAANATASGTSAGVVSSGMHGGQRAAGSSNKSGSYLGITYAAEGRNMFVLFDPKGNLAWKYQKSHPVPFLEQSAPGTAVLPTHDAPFGRLGGAICFDMDYPEFIAQSSRARVDILLQVSNTWGTVGRRHFWDNALRAVENGFTMVRCSAGGFSGVVDATYMARHYLVTLYSGVKVFTVPISRHRTTLYGLGGWLFGPALCAAASLLIWGLLSVPARYAAVLARRAPWLLGKVVSVDAEVDGEEWLQVPLQLDGSDAEDGLVQTPETPER